MTTDYLSALNVGSGLNTTEIIDSLVEAERAPRAKMIDDNKAERTVAISSLGSVKTNFESFDTKLGNLDGTTGLKISSATTAVDIALSDSTVAKSFSHQIGVSQLAAAHTLVFGSYSSESAAIGTGTLNFSFGTWASNGSFSANSSRTAKDITISSTNATLAGLRDSINDADLQVTASIIRTDDTNYALALKSREGVSHSMRITATENPSGSGLNALAYTAVNNSIQSVAGADAALTLDGVSITRQSNVIDDLVEGVSMTLKSTTSQNGTIAAAYDNSTALTAMKTLVEEINKIQTDLRSLTKRGLNGQEAGALASDSLVKSLQRQLSAYTTTPIVGFGNSSVYLAEFGVTTNRDGSISLNEATFNAQFTAKPDNFSAIMQSRVTTDTNLVKGSVTGSLYKPGKYAFDIASDGSATLAGTAMTRAVNRYSITTGNAAGLILDITGGGLDTNVYIGTSLLDSLRSFSQNIVKTGSDLNTKITRYNADLTKYADQLTSLDESVAATRARYVAKFAAMDKVSASMKKTGESLTNMMEAWKATMKNQ